MDASEFALPSGLQVNDLGRTVEERTILNANGQSQRVAYEIMSDKTKDPFYNKMVMENKEIQGKTKPVVMPGDYRTDVYNKWLKTQFNGSRGPNDKDNRYDPMTYLNEYNEATPEYWLKEMQYYDRGLPPEKPYQPVINPVKPYQHKLGESLNYEQGSDLLNQRRVWEQDQTVNIPTFWPGMNPDEYYNPKRPLIPPAWTDTDVDAMGNSRGAGFNQRLIPPDQYSTPQETLVTKEIQQSNVFNININGSSLDVNTIVAKVTEGVMAAMKQTPKISNQ